MSDQLLTVAQVRRLVACPTCRAPRGRSCRALAPAQGEMSRNHFARLAQARAVVRELRLGPLRPS